MAESTKPDVIPVWLDCDPGHDDAFALLLACYSPKIKLLGVSIVHGNDSVDHCALNALRMLWAFGVEGIPVYKGIQRPIIRKPKYCPEIHGIPGKDGVAGMCGYHFPDEKIHRGKDAKYKVGEMNGVIAMCNAIMEHPNKVTVVLTGAQTNLAIGLRMYPNIKERIEKVVFMGGAIGLGNTGIAAEFNIQIDPEAAAVVLHSGLPLVMIPLEITHQVLVTPEILLKLANIDNLDTNSMGMVKESEGKHSQLPHRHLEYPEIFQGIERAKRMNDNAPIATDQTSEFSSNFAECCHQLLTFFKGTYCREFGFSSPPLHDPCTIFYLVSPQSFTGVDLFVDVETGSEKCAGRTLCDMNNLSKQPKNVHVCTSINVSDFWSYFLSKLKMASENSPLNQS